MANVNIEIFVNHNYFDEVKLYVEFRLKFIFKYLFNCRRIVPRYVNLTLFLSICKYYDKNFPITNLFEKTINITKESQEYIYIISECSTYFNIDLQRQRNLTERKSESRITFSERINRKIFL